MVPKFGEYTVGGMAADAINQTVFQGREWREYNIGSTLTSGLLGGRNLLLSAGWQSSGSLINLTYNGINTGTVFKVSNDNYNAFKAGLVGNMMSGGATMFFKSVGGFTSSSLKTSGAGVKLLFQTVDGGNALFGGVVSNKVEDGLNKK